MRVWAVLAVAMLMAGCATSPGTSPVEKAPDVEPSCPDGLVDPTPLDHGLGTNTPAARAPSVGSLTQAWVCTYESVGTSSTEPGGGSVYTWTLVEGPAEVEAARLDEASELIATLAPAESMRACTADLGPRVMLVAATGLGTLGMVVDDYGCRDVRLTDDPWTVAPGESTTEYIPSGVLTGSEGIIATLEDLAVD